MRISLDFDGVLGNTMALWVDEFDRLHPSKKANIWDINEWNFFDKSPFDINVDETFEIFDFCWKHWEQIKPIEVEQSYKINELRKLGKVDVVSAIVKNKDSIRKWLSAQNIEIDDIVFTQEKWKLKYNYYIDDSPSNASKIKIEGKICLLYDQKWNRDVKTNGNIRRVYNLNHAIDVIRRLENEIKS